MSSSLHLLKTLSLATALSLSVSACAIPDEEVLVDDDLTEEIEAGSLGASCTAHNECNDLLMCNADSKCADPFPLTFALNVHNAIIEPTKEGGDDWDIDASAPDVFVEMALQGSDESVVTTLYDDTFEPEWQEAAEFTINETDKINVFTFDADLDSNDTIGSVAITASNVITALKYSDDATLPTVENGNYSLFLSVGLPQ